MVRLEGGARRRMSRWTTEAMARRCWQDGASMKGQHGLYQGRSERGTYLCPEADSLRTRPELVVRLLNPKGDLVLLRLFRKTNDQHPSLSRHFVLEQSTRPTNAGLARVAQLSILAEWDRGGGRRSEMDRKFEPARVRCSNLLVSPTSSEMERERTCSLLAAARPCWTRSSVRPTVFD